MSIPGLERDQPNVEQPVEDLRHVLDPDPPQAALLAGRDVHEPRPTRLAIPPMARSRAGGGDAVGDAETHHEVAGVLLRKNAPHHLGGPDTPSSIDSRPSFAYAGIVRAHVKPILAGLQLLDLVHAFRRDQHKRRIRAGAGAVAPESGLVDRLVLPQNENSRSGERSRQRAPYQRRRADKYPELYVSRSGREGWRRRRAAQSGGIPGGVADRQAREWRSPARRPHETRPVARIPTRQRRPCAQEPGERDPVSPVTGLTDRRPRAVPARRILP